MAQLRHSFLQSQTLRDQMCYVERKGTMYLLRDYNLIFHGCVPVDDAGNFLPLTVDGVEYRGRALFDALGHVVHRAFRNKERRHLDMLWYLWCGPLSPLFGKDKISTFENYFVAEKAVRVETKNPYFKLIHEKTFCRKILRDFGVFKAGSLSTATSRLNLRRVNRLLRQVVKPSLLTVHSLRYVATKALH